MKQASLKIKSYATNVNVINNGDLRLRILNTLFLILGILSISYVFFLGNMVFNIVERRALESEVLALSNEVGDLELEYLSASQKVDLNLAYSLGFEEAKIKYTASKNIGHSANIDSLSIAKNEI